MRKALLFLMSFILSFFCMKQNASFNNHKAIDLEVLRCSEVFSFSKLNQALFKDPKHSNNCEISNWQLRLKYNQGVPRKYLVKNVAEDEKLFKSISPKNEDSTVFLEIFENKFRISVIKEGLNISTNFDSRMKQKNKGISKLIEGKIFWTDSTHFILVPFERGHQRFLSIFTDSSNEKKISNKTKYNFMIHTGDKVYKLSKGAAIILDSNIRQFELDGAQIERLTVLINRNYSISIFNLLDYSNSIATLEVTSRDLSSKINGFVLNSIIYLEIAGDLISLEKIPEELAVNYFGAVNSYIIK